MQEPKINKKSKTPHKTTIPRRWLFYFSLRTTQNQNTLPYGSVFIYSLWWSCGVLPPGPNGNKLFAYRYSLPSIFTTCLAKSQTKILTCRVVNFLPIPPLRNTRMSIVNITPPTLTIPEAGDARAY